MSTQQKQLNCVACKAYLFEDDDVVHCPVCGAPHHRDCYNKIGHCALEELHGTDQEYDSTKAEQNTENDQNQSTQSNAENYTICRMCGEKYEKGLPKCPKCSAPDFSRMGPFAHFDFLGGVPGDLDLGEGVTANEAKKFVASNTQRYIPKFLGFKNGKKASWNWLAFLTPCGWLMSRKMYLLGAVIGALEIAFSLVSMPLRIAYQMVEVPDTSNRIEIYNAIFTEISNIGKVAIYAGLIAIALEVIMCIVIAIFGDLIYKKRVITKVSEIKLESEDQRELYRKKGGISMAAAVFGYFAVSYLPTIIAYTLGML